MKTIKYTHKPELPVFHLQTKTNDGYILTMTSEQKPEPGDQLITWEKSYICQEILEERVSTQDYGQGVRGNFYKVSATLLKLNPVK